MFVHLFSLILNWFWMYGLECNGMFTVLLSTVVSGKRSECTFRSASVYIFFVFLLSTCLGSEHLVSF